MNFMDDNTCRRCGATYRWHPIAEKIDKTGEKYGFMAVCPECGHRDITRFTGGIFVERHRYIMLVLWKSLFKEAGNKVVITKKDEHE